MSIVRYAWHRENPSGLMNLVESGLIVLAGRHYVLAHVETRSQQRACLSTLKNVIQPPRYNQALFVWHVDVSVAISTHVHCTEHILHIPTHNLCQRVIACTQNLLTHNSCKRVMIHLKDVNTRIPSVVLLFFYHWKKNFVLYRGTCLNYMCYKPRNSSNPPGFWNLFVIDPTALWRLFILLLRESKKKAFLSQDFHCYRYVIKSISIGITSRSGAIV